MKEGSVGPVRIRLADWTPRQIDQACREPYASYRTQVYARHVSYYAQRPEQRSTKHPFAAAERPLAFPPGWDALADALPDQAWHRHHLSGASSQVLAIALLGAATAKDPSLAWLSLPNVGEPVSSRFEVALDAKLLNERPRVTSIDWLVETPRTVVVAEAKFTEQGFGRCSCPRRALGDCGQRVRARPYWDVARRCLGAEGPHPPGPCQLDLAYQAVRNVAAARALGVGRQAVFALLHDERNPYFAGAASWPGWVALLARCLEGSGVLFWPISWQRLLGRAPISPTVAQWASEKHGLDCLDAAHRTAASMHDGPSARTTGGDR